MDHKWGADVLVELVDVDLAVKYGKAIASLNEKIDDEDLDGVRQWVGVCLRGLQTLDKAATESGAKPASEDFWIIEADGYRFGLMRDARRHKKLQELHPEIEMITDREMVLAVLYYKQSAVHGMMKKVKEHYPGADVVRLNFGKFTEDNLDDVFCDNGNK